MERRLAAILLTDMVGYSQLIGLDEEGTIARQNRHREEIFDPNISVYGGRIVKTTGDGLLVEFASVVDAVKCAVEVQQALAGLEAEVAHDRRIQYRIGINLGDIVIDGDDILGDGVNLAARLEGLAKPGGICISGNVYDQLAGKLNVAFADAGEQTVKNVPRPVRIWQWQIDKTRQSPGNNGAPLSFPDQPSIAVMPFTSLSADPEQEFFADGIAEDIINTLSKISKIRVIARHSTFAYKGKTMDVRKIAHDLDVRYVLEGSVRRAGERLRITAQLIDTQGGAQVWAERFDRQVDDLFDIQDEITKEVVTAFRVKLTDGEEAFAWARGTNNIEAWQCFIKAKELQDRLSATHLFEARSYAEKALELDPDYAYAWAVLGFSYFREARLDFSGDREARLHRASEIADKAFFLDASNPWAIALRAMTRAALGKHAEAEKIARRAIDMHPGNAEIRAFSGFVFGFCGKFRDALEQVEIALSLNPFAPTWYQSSSFRSHSLLGEYDKALSIISEVLLIEPDNIPARIFQSYCLEASGQHELASRAINALRRYMPHFRTSNLAGFLSMRDTALVEHVIETLRKAGLPEDDERSVLTTP